MTHYRVVELAAAGNTFRDTIETNIVFFRTVTAKTHAHAVQATKLRELAVVQQVRPHVHGEDADLMTLLSGGARDSDDMFEMPIGIDQDAEFHRFLLQAPLRLGIEAFDALVWQDMIILPAGSGGGEPHA